MASELELEDLVNRISGPSQRLLEEFRADKKRRILSDKLAMKADKLLIAESKRSGRMATKKPQGLARRLIGRAGGAAMGGMGNALGSIPIAGALFRAIGQESSKMLKDRKQYKRELIKQREIELKLMQQQEALTKKQEALRTAQEAKRIAAEEKAEQKKAKDEAKKVAERERAKQNYEQTSSIQRLNASSEQLQAAMAAIVPVVQTFVETAEKANSNGGMGGANRVVDQQVLDYLYAADFFAQETAAGVEKLYSITSDTAKDTGNIKWHISRLSGSNQRIEKTLTTFVSSQTKESVDIAKLTTGVENIKWHISRVSGSSQRIEKIMKQAAYDRQAMLDQQEKLIESNKKQVENQEDQKLIGILGLLTNLIGGAGIGRMLGALGKASVATVAIVGAWEVGQAIGEKLYSWLSDSNIFTAITDKLFYMMDVIMAKFGNKDAQQRLNMMDSISNRESLINHAKEFREGQGKQYTAADEAYLMEHGTLPNVDRNLFNYQREATIPWINHDYMKSVSRQEAWRLANNRDTASGVEAQINSMSKDVMNRTSTSGSTPKVIQNNANSTTNNNQTVIPHVLSASPTNPRMRTLN